METSSILTIFLVMVSVAGAGIYGSDHIFESQSLSEEDINETISEDQETNEETVGEGREIQGRDGAHEASSEDEGRNTLDISMVSPSENAEFEVVEGEEKEIEFQYDIISSSEGEATLNIGGNEIEETIEEGNQRITSNIELQPGEYEWHINADNDVLTEVSSSQNIEIMETGIEEGVLELSDNPAVEQYNTITLYQEDEPVQGEEILINDEPYGETDQLGEISFEVPNTEEITIDTDLDGINSITEQVDGYEPAIEVDFEFLDDLIQREEATLKVTDNTDEENPEVLEGEEVYVDGSSRGETDSDGEINFEIPEKDQIEVYIVYEEEQHSETFNTEREDILIDLSRPDDGEDFDYTVEIGFLIDSIVNADYELIKSGETVREGEVNDESKFIEETRYVENPGSYDWSVVAQASGETYESEIRTFETTEERPISEIDTTIQDGQTIPHTDGDLAIVLRPFEDITMVSRIDGEEVFTETYTTQEDYDTVTRDTSGTELGLEPDSEHTWEIEVETGKDSITEQLQIFTEEE